MYAPWPAPREAQTTLPCRACAAPLKAVRACREVTLRCPKCAKSYSVTDYAAQMDDVLEDFLDNVMCNRI